jgi:hypothetical protein
MSTSVGVCERGIEGQEGIGPRRQPAATDSGGTQTPVGGAVGSDGSQINGSNVKRGSGSATVRGPREGNPLKAGKPQGRYRGETRNGCRRSKSSKPWESAWVARKSVVANRRDLDSASLSGEGAKKPKRGVRTQQTEACFMSCGWTGSTVGRRRGGKSQERRQNEHH